MAIITNGNCFFVWKILLCFISSLFWFVLLFLASVDNFCIALKLAGRVYFLWQQRFKAPLFLMIPKPIFLTLSRAVWIKIWSHEIQLQAYYCSHLYTSFYYSFKTTDFILNAKIFILFCLFRDNFTPHVFFLYLASSYFPPLVRKTKILSSTVSFLSLFQDTNHNWQKNLEISGWSVRFYRILIWQKVFCNFVCFLFVG